MVATKRNGNFNVYIHLYIMVKNRDIIVFKKCIQCHSCEGWIFDVTNENWITCITHNRVGNVICHKPQLNPQLYVVVIILLILLITALITVYNISVQWEAYTSFCLQITRGMKNMRLCNMSVYKIMLQCTVRAQ